MICISLWQPWASLLVGGHKRVETRHWPIRHRGPLLIHAAQKWSGELYEMCRAEPFRAAIVDLGHSISVPSSRGKILAPRGMPFGAIVGQVDVMECVAISPSPVEYDWANESRMHIGRGRFTVPPDEPERSFGDYTPGRFAWLCANPVRFKTPIPYRGGQGLFDVPDDLLVDAIAAGTVPKPIHPTPGA
jgi:hypothetical protein